MWKRKKGNDSAFTTGHLDGETCGDNYCGIGWSGNTVTGIEPDLSAYFEAAGDTLLEPHVDTIIERLKDLKGRQSAERRKKNSGNIILILKSVGNTPNVPAGERYQWKDLPPEWLQSLQDMPVIGQELYNFFQKGSNTVHGSISTYDSNVLFLMFYPYGEGSPQIRSRIETFLDDYTPNAQYGTTTIDRLMNNHSKVFENAVTNSNDILMEKGGN